MAGFILVCWRTPAERPRSRRDIEWCARRLAPDNIDPNPPLVHEEEGLLVCLVNPVPAIRWRAGNLLLGGGFGERTDWAELGTSPPDGAHAVVRLDDARLEILADSVASRTVWYTFTDRVFLASTSQRALVMLLGGFDPNQEAVSWMLSSGGLGPGLSWDTRLRRLGGAERLLLDRRHWRLTTKCDEIAFRPLNLSKSEHAARLRDALLDSCANLGLVDSQWLLALSGGMDSRGVLLGLLHAGHRPRCVTWGLRDSAFMDGSDASVARKLASALGVEHEYYPTDDTEVSSGELMGRFLRASEGQTEDIAGYMDGMAMWRTFFASGISGVIRADIPSMGYWPASSALEVRLRGRGTMVSDFPPAHPIRGLGLAHQNWPNSLNKRPDETMYTYDSRFYEALYFPHLLAPLNDAKCAYVEVVNPLLAESVVRAAHELPDELRPHKQAFKAAVRLLSPPIPYARHSATASPQAILGTENFRSEIARGLSSASAGRVLSEAALATIKSGLAAPTGAAKPSRVRAAAKAVIPWKVAHKVRPLPRLRLSGRALAFRAYIAAQIVEILEEDVRAFAQQRERSAKEGGGSAE